MNQITLHSIGEKIKQWCPHGPGMSPTQFAIIVLGGSALATLFGFVALPVSNPLHDQNAMTNWWHCPLNCTLMWTFLGIIYIQRMIEVFVLLPVKKRIWGAADPDVEGGGTWDAHKKQSCGNNPENVEFRGWGINVNSGAGARRTLLAVTLYDTFSMWSVQSFVMSFFIILLNHIWAYPAPFVGLFGGLAGIISVATYIYFIVIPRIIRRYVTDRSGDKVITGSVSMSIDSKQNKNQDFFEPWQAIGMEESIETPCFSPLRPMGKKSIITVNHASDDPFDHELAPEGGLINECASTQTNVHADAYTSSNANVKFDMESSDNRSASRAQVEEVEDKCNGMFRTRQAQDDALGIEALGGEEIITSPTTSVPSPLRFERRNAHATACDVHKIKRLLEDSALNLMPRKALWVVVFFVASILAVCLNLMIAALVTISATNNRLRYIAAFAMPVLRWFDKVCLSFIVEKIDERATVVAQNLSYLSCGVSVVIIVGSISDYFLTLALVFIDISLGADAVTRIVRARKWLLKTELNLSKETKTEIESFMIDEIVSWIVISEIGEIVLPLAYLICWYIIYMGPNSASFSGVGTSEFGLTPPQDMVSFALNLLLMFGVELLTGCAFFICIKRWASISLLNACRSLFANYGAVMSTQSVWVIVTAFCCTMISCGFDYTYEFKHAKGG